MAAQDAVVLENHVRLFVETKLAEEVVVELHTGRVSIKPKNKTGSITLASFWVRVLQNYFPTNKHAYRKGYSSTAGSETLAVKVDEFLLTIYLRSGLVMCEGDYAYNWFKIVFRKVMDAYDRVTHSNTKEYFTDQIILDTRKELQRKEKMYEDETIKPETVNERLALVSSDVQLSGQAEDYIVTRPASESLASQQQQTRVSSTEVSLSGSLAGVALKDGHSYVYPMWRQLLNKWLSRDGCRVYVASASIDVDRLRDLAKMAYQNRLICQLKAIYTDAIGQDGRRMSKVRDDLLQGHATSDEQLFIEYKVFNKIKLPTTKKVNHQGQFNRSMCSLVKLVSTEVAVSKVYKCLRHLLIQQQFETLSEKIAGCGSNSIKLASSTLY